MPMFVNNTPIFEVEKRITHEGDFGVHRPRQVQRSSPTRTASTRLLNGEISSITVTPADFTEDRQASKYVITVDDQDRVPRREGRQGPVVEPVSAVPRGLRGLQHGERDRSAAFLGQDVNALDRLATELARSIVSAILEAF